MSNFRPELRREIFAVLRR